MYSLLQRIISLRHRFWYGVSERLRWSRGIVRETPTRKLPEWTLDQASRIAALQSRYQVRFERHLGPATAARNYEYLDILDRAWASSGLARPQGGELTDVGCASFWYAAALNVFFSPHVLVGVEVEGHRFFKDGHTRIDHAAGFIEALPHSRFLIADYCNLELPADVITAWFPFMTPAAILAWRLPLSLLSPARLLRRIAINLRTGGQFVMVNHGAVEAAVAEQLCSATGLRRVFTFAEQGLLSTHRLEPAMLSLWQRD